MRVALTEPSTRVQAPLQGLPLVLKQVDLEKELELSKQRQAAKVGSARA